MIRQTFGNVGAKLAFWMSGLAPEWAGAMFLGQPMAVPLRFSATHQHQTTDYLPVDVLSQELLPREKGTSRPVVDIVVPSEFFFQRRLKMPLSAKNKLEAMSLLDLKARTPFEMNGIFWRLGVPVFQDDAIHVPQWIVRREDVESWRRQLAKSSFLVRKVFVDDENLPLAIADFSDEIVPGRRKFQRLNTVLTAIAAIALLTGWLYPGWSSRSYTGGLQLELEELRSEAFLERQRVDEIRKTEAQKAAFIDAVLRRPLLLETVRELTLSLDDDVWISTLTFNTSHIVIAGEAQNSAAETVLSLGDRSKFGNPRLSGPVSRTSAGSEHFEITLDLGTSG